MRKLNNKACDEIAIIIIALVAVVAIVIVALCVVSVTSGPPMTVRYTCDKCGWNGTADERNYDTYYTYIMVAHHVGKITYFTTIPIAHHNYYCPACGSSSLTEHKYLTPQPVNATQTL
jgi:hypothetical protein